MAKKLTDQEFRAKIKRMLKAQKRALEWLQKQANKRQHKQTLQRNADIRRKSLKAVHNSPDPLLKNTSTCILVKKK